MSVLVHFFAVCLSGRAMRNERVLLLEQRSDSAVR